jgi:NadR type nicotinamide-nucleotide adenylyltransferase
MKKYKKGLVVGKFYPPHRGHKYLIDSAHEQSEHVTIIVCAKSSEWIPGLLRKKWIETIHPHATVLLLEDYTLDDNDSKAWAEFTINLLGQAPDAVFTSEDYGHAYAKFMACDHVQVDKPRARVPISGTLVRANPLSQLHHLEPIVRAHFIPRIAIVGAESTGTTTLARDLAKHYGTVWVPEYGRMYSEGTLTNKEHVWTTNDFVHIARAQQHMEDALALQAINILFADTDAFATSIWHERYMGSESPDVETIANGRSYTLYIVTGDEIPFEQDGTRDGEHIRHWMHERFIEKLTNTNRPFIAVSGTKEERLQQAIGHIDRTVRGIALSRTIIRGDSTHSSSGV